MEHGELQRMHSEEFCDLTSKVALIKFVRGFPGIIYDKMDKQPQCLGTTVCCFPCKDSPVMCLYRLLFLKLSLSSTK